MKTTEAMSTATATPSTTTRVVVTGLGVTAPNGLGTDDFWSATVEGRSGIGEIGRFDASGSNAIPPSTGRSVSASMSWRVWMRLSSTVRSTAIAMPRANPTMPPSTMSMRTLGLVCVVGATAGSVTLMRTGLTAPSAAGCSRVFCTAS